MREWVDIAEQVQHGHGKVSASRGDLHTSRCSESTERLSLVAMEAPLIRLQLLLLEATAAAPMTLGRAQHPCGVLLAVV